MASMDKLMKALEALKVMQPSDSTEDTTLKKKETMALAKEKILYCSIIADTICSYNFRFSTDFPKVLGLAMDTFLLCCDDESSDVRLMADECLNRTIKTLLDSHLGRLMVELFKEIKKCGPARSLRAALSRFGDICHLMRPQKCRPYTVNLIPALIKICQRKDEESLQETLAIAFTKIMPVLGQYTNDKDIKNLLKIFLPNLTVTSAIVRRAAATSLTFICLNSRRPSSFFSWLLLGLFDLILPIQEEYSVYTILGVLVCLRNIIPHLNETMLAPSFRNNVNNLQNDDDAGVTKEQLLKVYEITLHFCHHSDHNVVTATLETLYQVLKCAPNQLQQVLVSPFGITKSWIFEAPKLNRIISESQNSIVPSSTSLDESALVDDLDIYMPENKVDNHLSYCEDISDTISQNTDLSLVLDGDMMETEPNLLYRQESENYFFGSPEAQRNSFLKKGASDEDMLDMDDEFWGLNTATPSPGPLSKPEFKVGNIGTFTDSDVALKYCCRLLCSSFLLNGFPNGTLPDRNVKISVKSLALGCLSNVFSLYPSNFFLTLYIEKNENIESQKIWDIHSYSSHPDPHIRGQAGVMIGHFLGSALRKAGGWWSKWTAFYIDNDSGFPTLPFLLSKLLCIIQDNSSLAARLGLLGLKQCLSYLLNSVEALECFHLLDILISAKTNAYWLAKVELVEVVACIPFKTVHYLEYKHSSREVFYNDSCYQDKILKEVLIPLLGDEDVRVRQAAAVALVKLLPQLYFPIDYPNKDTITVTAKEMISCYLDISIKDPFCSAFPLVHALVKPFASSSVTFSQVVDTGLSRIIDMLLTTLRLCTKKYLTYGCCNALCLLAEKYNVTNFPETWAATYADFKNEKISNEIITITQTQSLVNDPLEVNIHFGNDSYSDLLSHLISLASSTSLCLDIVAHQHVLQLAGNLLCGVWYKSNVEHHKNSYGGNQDPDIDLYLSLVTGKLFSHIMRLLNIYTHVLEETYPMSASSRTALPSLPNAPSLSPIKRKNKVKEEISTTSSNSKGSPVKIPEKLDIEKERSSSRIGGSVGLFHSSPLYMKLFEILRGTYCSYKISMDFQSSEKFCLLLSCSLEVMCQILEISDSSEMGKNAEEILCYMKSIMVMEASSAVQCVRQLLKCLFGTNLMMLCRDAQMISGSCEKGESPNRIFTPVPGLYHTIISYPYSQFTHALAEKAMRVPGDKITDHVSFRSLNWVKKGSDKVTILLKSGAKLEKSSLANHIRLFEGVVIRSLQQYTISSDVKLQCEVLDLLAQLVQLRVNYCLLDADQVFISHVLKQFEYIEEGQIPNAEALISRIFYFLILLSYERFHSKMVVTVPQILQHCDRLIASGQSPEKYG